MEFKSNRLLIEEFSQEELERIANYYDEIQETDGVKHLIPLDQIVSGTVGKDVIPSIDNPKFDSVFAADTYLGDDGYGIDVEVAGEHRFYPYQILVWHEIVNEEFNGALLAITYCPLCFTGIVFDRSVGNTTHEFGVSGKLFDNNLLMYDRETESYWSQARGQAVVGDLTGTELEQYPSRIMSWGDWKEQYPDGLVLNRQTGAIRDYTYFPYGNYQNNQAIYFPLSHIDGRLASKEIVFGLEIDGESVAYVESEIRAVEQIEDWLGGRPVVVLYDESQRAIVAYDAETEDDLVLQPTYWFSWVATYPATEVWGEESEE